MELKKRILLTDDDPGILDALEIMMKHAGYQVIVLKNAQELLNGNFELPDLFLLDKQLSGRNGLDICRHLKQQETTRHIPVIMLSATPDLGKMATEAHADDFMEKPFKMSELLDKIARHLSA